MSLKKIMIEGKVLQSGTIPLTSGMRWLDKDFKVYKTYGVERAEEKYISQATNLEKFVVIKRYVLPG